MVTWARRELEDSGTGTGDVYLGGGLGSHMPAWPECMLHFHANLWDTNKHATMNVKKLLHSKAVVFPFITLTRSKLLITGETGQEVH